MIRTVPGMRFLTLRKPRASGDDPFIYLRRYNTEL